MKTTCKSISDEKIAREKWLEARLRRIWQNRKSLHESNNEKKRSMTQLSEMTSRYIPEAV